MSIALPAVAVTLLLTSACGYALSGRGNALPASIQIIGVPQFVNLSTVGNIDRALTDAVRAEFQSKGKYQVRSDDIGVHGLLTGSVTSVTLRPTTFDENRMPSGYGIVVITNIEFKQLNDPDDSAKVLWANPVFRVTDDYQLATGRLTGTVDAAEFSQNTQAVERLAKKFAKDIVTSIFEAF